MQPLGTISLDLDGCRWLSQLPEIWLYSLRFHDMAKIHDMFTICLFISPDLDGHRAPKMKYCPRRDP